MDKPNEQKVDSQHNPADFQMNVYSFSASELASIAPWDASVQVGILAQNVIGNIIRTSSFKRLGIKDSPDVRVEYAVLDNKLTVYVPKVWCSMCKNRRAEFSYKGKVYCKDCANALKTQQPPVVEKKEEVKVEDKPKKKTKPTVS